MKDNWITTRHEEERRQPPGDTNENIGLNFFFKIKTEIDYLINLKTKGKELCIY